MSYHSADIRIIVGSRGGYIASGRRGNNFSVNPVLLPYNATNISCTCNRGGRMAINNISTRTVSNYSAYIHS